MKSRKRWAVLLAVCTVLSLAGCSSGTTVQREPVEGLDKLDSIQVVAREDGSGMRGAFAQLVDFEGSDSESQQSDQTTSDAQIANNAQEVIDAVQDNPAAIGYVSKGALSEETDVKALSVGGIAIECMASLTVPFNSILHCIDRIGNSCINIADAVSDQVNIRYFIHEDEKAKVKV